jgi:hypothetical protein
MGHDSRIFKKKKKGHDPGHAVGILGVPEI